MNFYYFDIVNNRIDEFNGEVSGVGPEFHQYEKSFGMEEIYYLAKQGKIAEVICEAIDLKNAEKATKDFLSSVS